MSTVVIVPVGGGDGGSDDTFGVHNGSWIILLIVIGGVFCGIPLLCSICHYWYKLVSWVIKKCNELKRRMKQSRPMKQPLVETLPHDIELGYPQQPKEPAPCTCPKCTGKTPSTIAEALAFEGEIVKYHGNQKNIV